MIALLLAAAPLENSPEWIDRAMIMHRTEYPIIFELIDAARKGDEAEFQKHVRAGATISLPSQGIVPFTSTSIRDLAMRCMASDKVRTRFLYDRDELSIMWSCPGDIPSPMTTLIFAGGKIIHAETEAAVIQVAPAPEKGA